MTALVIRSDAARLPLPDNSVDLIVTSPPYFALRSYQDGGEHYANQIGSEPTPQEFLEALWTCTAEWMRVVKPSGSIFVNLGDKYAGQGSAPVGARRVDPCPASAATYQDRSAVGTPGLASDQCPSDSSLSAQSPQYPSHPSPYGENDAPQRRQVVSSSVGIEPGSFRQGARDGNRRSRPSPVEGIPGKSLMLLPERYRIGCVDRLGLIARSVIIWDKPNGLPESVTDRVRRSHEDWVHLTLLPRYFSAIDEIREPVNVRKGMVTWQDRVAGKGRSYSPDNGHNAGGAGMMPNELGKLPGSVWTVATEPLNVPDHLGVDHFAAFPTEFPRRIIQGWSPAGICVECGEGRRPVAERQAGGRERATTSGRDPSWQAINRADWQENVTRLITGYTCACGTMEGNTWTPTPSPTSAPAKGADAMAHQAGSAIGSSTDISRSAASSCNPPPTRPSVILDPFGGTGTTALCASVLGRIGISVDLSADYGRLARWRTTDPGQRAKAMRVDKPPVQLDGQYDMFGGAA